MILSWQRVVLKPDTAFTQVLWTSLIKIIYPLQPAEIGCRAREMTWLAVQWAEYFPVSTGCSQHCFPVDRSMCEVCAFCSKSVWSSAFRLTVELVCVPIMCHPPDSLPLPPVFSTVGFVPFVPDQFLTSSSLTEVSETVIYFTVDE